MDQSCHHGRFALTMHGHVLRKRGHFCRSLCHKSSHSGHSGGVPELQSIPQFAIAATQPCFQILSVSWNGSELPAEWEELRRSTPLEAPSWVGWPSTRRTPGPTGRFCVATRRLTDPLAVLAAPRTKTATAPIVLRHPAVLTLAITASVRTKRFLALSMKLLHASILSFTGRTLDLARATRRASFNGVECGLLSPNAAMAPNKRSTSALASAATASGGATARSLRKNVVSLHLRQLRRSPGNG